MPALLRRRLGRTGLDVSVLGFGTAPLGDLFIRIPDDVAIATVERAFALGINLLDSSPLYGRGLAEHRCGTALRRVNRPDIVLCTKVGRWMDPFHAPDDVAGFVGGRPHRAVFDYSYDGTMRSVEQSLLRLGTDRLDLLLIHDVDVWTHGRDAIEQRFRQAMEGAYVALDRLRGEGVVKGIGVMLGGVFNSGILATGAVSSAKYNYCDAPAEILDRVSRIERVCAAHNTPLPTAALHFALGHPAVASLVLGGVTPQEVERNVAALSSQVPPALWRDLKAAHLLDEAAPVPEHD